MEMSQAARIDSKFVTAEEVGEILGVSSARTRELIDLVENGTKEKASRTRGSNAVTKVSTRVTHRNGNGRPAKGIRSGSRTVLRRKSKRAKVAKTRH